jgi:hypothetical protein
LACGGVNCGCAVVDMFAADGARGVGEIFVVRMGWNL